VVFAGFAIFRPHRATMTGVVIVIIVVFVGPSDMFPKQKVMTSKQNSIPMQKALISMQTVMIPKQKVRIPKQHVINLYDFMMIP
jgi:hypothetical protein